MLVLRFLLFCFKSVQTYLKIFHSKGFVGVEVVNLLSQVSHGVVVLHAQSSKGSLVSPV